MLVDARAVCYTFTADENLFVRKRVNMNDEAQHASRSWSQAVEKVTAVMFVHEGVSQVGAVWCVLTSQEKRFKPQSIPAETAI